MSASTDSASAELPYLRQGRLTTRRPICRSLRSTKEEASVVDSATAALTAPSIQWLSLG